MPKSEKKQKKKLVEADEVQINMTDVTADAAQDIVQDVTADAAQNVTQDVVQDATQDVADDGADKIDFERELMREIPKVFGGDAAKPDKDEKSDADRVSQIQKILKRVFLLLKDGDFQKADALCEQVLDLDSKSGEAYLGRLMAELRAHEVKDLMDQPKSFETNENYQRLMRFGSPELREGMKTIITAINERNEDDSKAVVFSKAAEMLERAKTVVDCEKAAALFRTITDYDGVDKKLIECGDKAEKIRKTAYQAACELLEQGFARRAMSVFVDLGDYQDSRKKIQDCQDAINANTYESAVILKSQKRWIEAANAFDTLGEFKDSLEQAEECNRLLEEALHKEKEQNEQAARAAKKRIIARRILLIAIAVIVAAAGLMLLAYNVLLPEQKREQVSAMMKAGRYQEAAAMFADLGNYRDAKDIIKAAETATSEPTETETPEPTETATSEPTETATPEPTETAALAQAVPDGDYAVGDCVTFGHYPQTDDEAVQTPIEWKVVAKDGRKALLVSRYGLDCKPYNTQKTDVTWETCTLRQWLNGEFLKKAFAPAEQAAIATTEVDNSSAQGSPDWSADGGGNTRDKVFLLSCQEAEKYFPDGASRRCASTDYAVKNNAWASDMYEADGRSACFWWLRSPGSSLSYAAQVSEGGNLGEFTVNNGYTAVRPAIWVDLDSGLLSEVAPSDTENSGQ